MGAAAVIIRGKRAGALKRPSIVANPEACLHEALRRFGEEMVIQEFIYRIWWTHSDIRVGVSFMNIELSRAPTAEKPIVRNLSQFYLYEFSKYMPSIRLEAQRGLYDGLPDLDAYWDDPNRVAFILRVDGELAGFALVIKGTSDQPHQIGEFFVLQKFSGRGIGKSVAQQIFDMLPGDWLIHEMWNNDAAQAFWRSAVNTYTKGHYEEYYDEHRRPFQKFSARREFRESSPSNSLRG